MNESGRCRRAMSSALLRTASGVFGAILRWNFGVGSAHWSITSRMTSESGLYSVVPSAFVPPIVTGWPQ